MADQQYYSLFTKQGLTLLTEAINNGTKLGISHMAFGDGGGSLPVPNDEFTGLVNEVYRMPINSLAPDPNNANWLRAEAVIPSAVGGFNIRELGLYAGNVLVAYSNYPPTTKPAPGEGAAQIKSFRMILQIDNVANFELVIDADIVLATIQSVNEAKKELYENTVSTVESIADLDNLEKWNGRVVNVKSYYAGQKRGGALFIYDQSQLNINNSVTIFNGWIRQIADNTLTAYDCGLVGEIAVDGDSTSRLRALINIAIESGVKIIKADGQYKTTKAIAIRNTSDIQLSIEYLKFLPASNYAPEWSNSWGAIHVENCQNIIIKNSKIEGEFIHYPAMDSIESGQGGVSINLSRNCTVINVEVSQMVVWGILFTKSTDNTVCDCYVHDILRQGGINANIQGCQRSRIYNNTVERCGLVGIELEDPSTSYSDDIEIFSNIVRNCKTGISIIHNINKASVFGNTIIDCNYGFLATSNGNDSSSIDWLITKNIFKNCRNGYYVTDLHTGKSVVTANEITHDGVDRYFIQSQYNTVINSESPTIIVIGYVASLAAAIEVGYKVKINDIEATVTAVEELTTYQEFGNGRFRRITLSHDVSAKIGDFIYILGSSFQSNTIAANIGDQVTSVFLKNYYAGFAVGFNLFHSSWKGAQTILDSESLKDISVGAFLFINAISDGSMPIMIKNLNIISGVSTLVSKNESSLIKLLANNAIRGLKKYSVSYSQSVNEGNGSTLANGFNIAKTGIGSGFIVGCYFHVNNAASSTSEPIVLSISQSQDFSNQKIYTLQLSSVAVTSSKLNSSGSLKVDEFFNYKLTSTGDITKISYSQVVIDILII